MLEQVLLPRYSEMSRGRRVSQSGDWKGQPLSLSLFSYSSLLCSGEPVLQDNISSLLLPWVHAIKQLGCKPLICWAPEAAVATHFEIQTDKEEPGVRDLTFSNLPSYRPHSQGTTPGEEPAATPSPQGPAAVLPQSQTSDMICPILHLINFIFTQMTLQF